MSEETPSPDIALDDAAAEEAVAPKKESWLDLIWFMVKLMLFFFLLRSLVFSPFTIPSESMLPRLLIGDFLIVSKWNYGYSKYSFELPVQALRGSDGLDGPAPDPATTSGPVTRVFPGTPARGDVVVFKAPPTQEQDYIKRVIGLPGDRVQMVSGVLMLNGKAVPKVRIDDFVIPVTPNMIEASRSAPVLRNVCMEMRFLEHDKDGNALCRWPRYRETLPGGKSYEVLDITPFAAGDDTIEFKVPEGHVFLMGDNRDGSADSRFPAERGKAIGIVPIQNLIGKAQFIFFSSDGSAVWYKPWTWVSAARGDRIGEGI